MLDGTNGHDGSSVAFGEYRGSEAVMTAALRQRSVQFPHAAAQNAFDTFVTSSFINRTGRKMNRMSALAGAKTEWVKDVSLGRVSRRAVVS
jgi:hypothetical protein